MIPDWLHVLSIVSLAAGFISAALIVVDEIRQPQKMWIMNLVWPLTALFASVLALAAYFSVGRAKGHGASSFPVSVGLAATHCGSGCTLGDIIAEFLCLGFPAVAIWFGWQSLFSDKLFAIWIVDYIFAFVIGIFFQYFTIAPMRGLGFGEGLIAALKVDTLSLTSWQIGMYVLMALAQFFVFVPLTGKMVEANSVEFWFTMQIAMIAGFITSYPVNWWLVEAGIKEKM